VLILVVLFSRSGLLGLGRLLRRTDG
jgi:hypothetical protein